MYPTFTPEGEIVIIILVRKQIFLLLWKETLSSKDVCCTPTREKLI